MFENEGEQRLKSTTLTSPLSCAKLYMILGLMDLTHLLIGWILFCFVLFFDFVVIVVFILISLRYSVERGVGSPTMVEMLMVWVCGKILIRRQLC